MKRRLLTALAALLLGLVAIAQTQDLPDDIDTYVAQIGNRCPIDFDNQWAISKCVTTADTIYLEIQTPAALSMVLPALSGDTDNVRQLWIRQFRQYGDAWDKFIELMVAANRSLALTLQPLDSDDSATITFSPADFK